MMHNKYKLFALTMIPAMIFTLFSCSSHVTYISGPVSVIFHTSEDYEYIEEEMVPLSDIDGETDPLRGLAIEIFDLCNQEREAGGLKKFKWNEDLYTAAMERARELNESFSHTRPDGSHFYSVVEESGIPAGVVGENIAIGHKTAKELLQSWMQSDDIKKSILSDYEYIGIGVAECPNDIYDGFAFAQLLYNP